MVSKVSTDYRLGKLPFVCHNWMLVQSLYSDLFFNPRATTLTLKVIIGSEVPPFFSVGSTLVESFITI